MVVHMRFIAVLVVMLVSMAWPCRAAAQDPDVYDVTIVAGVADIPAPRGLDFG